MERTNQRTSTKIASPSHSRSPGTAATMLILGGIVLQLGGLGYMHVGLDYLWMLFLVLESTWNVISMHGNLPWLQQLIVFWPLLLVGVGLGILLIAGGSKTRRLQNRSHAMQHQLTPNARTRGSWWESGCAARHRLASRPDGNHRRRQDRPLMAHAAGWLPASGASLNFAGIPGRALGGVLVICLGVIFQLNELNISFLSTFTRFGRYSLIVGGLWIVLHSFLPHWGADRDAASAIGSINYQGRFQMDSTGSDLNAVAVLGGVQRNITSNKFKSGRLTAIMGGVEIDFVDADIEGDEAILDASAILGGIEIRVPDSWNVSFELVALLAGSSDERRRAPMPNSGAIPKHLIIRGAAVFAGVDGEKLIVAMHPSLHPSPAVSVLYLLVWIPDACLLTYLFTVAGGISGRDGALLAFPLTLIYAFVCLASWYPARATPLRVLRLHALGSHPSASARFSPPSSGFSPRGDG